VRADQKTSKKYLFGDGNVSVALEALLWVVLIVGVFIISYVGYTKYRTGSWYPEQQQQEAHENP